MSTREVVHESGAPAFGLRVILGGRTVAYSSDTEWTDELVELARGADVFVCEAYFFDKRISFHLDLATLEANLARLECGRVILTHMSEDMLDRLGDVALETAYDGLRLKI